MLVRVVYSKLYLSESSMDVRMVGVHVQTTKLVAVPFPLPPLPEEDRTMATCFGAVASTGLWRSLLDDMVVWRGSDGDAQKRG